MITNHKIYKKKPPKLSFRGFKFIQVNRLFGRELHSHTYYANTRLFKKFIEKFIEETPQIESKQKGDFVEESS